MVPPALTVLPSRLRVDPAPQAPRDLVLQPARQSLEALRSLDENWDGYGSTKPRIESIERALELLPSLHAAAEGRAAWEAPHISASEGGDVTLEWWRGAKSLTLFIRSDGIEYLESLARQADSGGWQVPPADWR
jgi:hypothetical protein